MVTENGQLIVGKSGHTSLTGGNSVQAAGELRLYNGEIKYIDNASGHFQPTGSNIAGISEKSFNDIGLNATGKFIPKQWVVDPTLPRGGRWVEIK